MTGDRGLPITQDDLKEIADVSFAQAQVMFGAAIGVVFGLFAILSLLDRAPRFGVEWLLLSIAYFGVCGVGHYVYWRWTEYTAMFWTAAETRKDSEGLSFSQKYEYVWEQMRKRFPFPRIPLVPNKPLTMREVTIPWIILGLLVSLSWLAVAFFN